MKDPLGNEIDFAPQISVEQYEDIAVAFFPKILGMEYSSVFITDLSSLNDFEGSHGDENTMEKMLARIKENYDIDLSAKEYLTLVKIFEKIRILHL